jgi:preprotein translocase subunit YajC
MDQEQLQSLSAYALPIIAVISMYLFVLLPQRKREKKSREMLNSIKEGQEIITVGGVIGKIVNIKNDEITIISSIEKTQLKLMRWAVREIVSEAAASK